MHLSTTIRESIANVARYRTFPLHAEQRRSKLWIIAPLPVA